MSRKTYQSLFLMTDEDLLAELNALSSFTVRMLEWGAAVYAELRRRGVSPVVGSAALASVLPGIAAGTLAAEAVTAFAGKPRLFRRIARLPVAEQRALAEGKPVDVVLVVGEAPVPMPVEDTVRVLDVVFAGDRIATPAEQEATLLRIRARRAKVRVVTERDRERLVERLETICRERGTDRPTPRQLIELAAALGWGPQRVSQ